MGNGLERALVIHARGDRPWLLRPGGRLSVGRDERNDVVVVHPTVSRFHAWIEWPAGDDLPMVRDRGSANGTFCGSRQVPPCGRLVLGPPERVRLGEQVLSVELTGEGAALLPDGRDSVCLIFDSGIPLRGHLDGGDGLVGVLRRLERERRTGTLRLRFPTGEGLVTFAAGRVMHAHCGACSGGEGVSAILAAARPGLPWSFSPTFELDDERPPLNLWASDLQRETTQRSRARVAQRFSPARVQQDAAA